MERGEIISLAKSNPKGLLNLIEHGELNSSDLTECCKVAGFYLPTAMCQRVLLKTLAATKDPEVFKGLLVALSPHSDEKYLSFMESLDQQTSHKDEIQSLLHREILFEHSWDGLDDPDTYELDGEDEDGD